MRPGNLFTIYTEDRYSPSAGFLGSVIREQNGWTRRDMSHRILRVSTVPVVE